MPRHPKKARRLVADGRAYMWTNRHGHHVPDGRRAAHCRQTLTLIPQPSGSGGPLRLVFTDGPDRFVPGGFTFGSGDVGYVHGGSLNLHEPGAVRALLDAALSHGWQPGERRPVELDGWLLLEEAAAALAVAAAQAADAGPTAR